MNVWLTACPLVFVIKGRGLTFSFSLPEEQIRGEFQKMRLLRMGLGSRVNIGTDDVWSGSLNLATGGRALFSFLHVVAPGSCRQSCQPHECTMMTKCKRAQKGKTACLLGELKARQSSVPRNCRPCHMCWQANQMELFGPGPKPCWYFLVHLVRSWPCLVSVA